MARMAKKTGFHDMFATIPKELWKALCADANENQRSATGQLIWILRQRYPDVKQPEGDKKKGGGR